MAVDSTSRKGVPPHRLEAVSRCKGNTMYTTRYKLFRAPRNRNLKRKTWIAHTLWNYFLGWQRTRYSLGLPYLSFYEMSREFTILKNSHPEIFEHWRELNTWSAREILKRLDAGYQRFFKCSVCQGKHHRDVNASINIVKVGASTFRLEGISLAIASNPRRLHPKSIPHDPHRKARIR